jgi:hypothetical protein
MELAMNRSTMQWTERKGCGDAACSFARRAPGENRRLWRLGQRLLVAFIAALLLTTIVYGESWLLEEAPASTVESAVATGVAHALDGDFTGI